MEICERGLDASPTSELLIEESVLGWKEFEMEVVRDRKDNCIIVCSIENFDPMGVHTGDSITVAPAQTLTDKEYQIMRDASIAVLREIGVDTGGSNVQFAINPDDGRMIVIEMNPRVSRSSALASKATGFPDRQGRRQAGRRLHAGRTAERNHRRRDAGLVRAHIDYVVTKIPRFTFEKFPQADAAPDHPDEIGGRGDGHRPHLPGVAAEGAARPGDRQVTAWIAMVDLDAEKRADADRLRAARAGRGTHLVRGRCLPRRHDVGRSVRAVPGSIPGSWCRSRSWCEIERQVREDGAGRPRCATAASAASARVFPIGGWPSCSVRPEGAIRELRHAPGCAPGLQAGGYLCRRICHQHRLYVLDL